MSEARRTVSQWQTEALAKIYLEGVRGAVPAAGLQLEIIQKILALWCPGLQRVIDLGCGDGVLGRAVLERFPSARVTFVDFSDPMLEAARAGLGDPERADLVKADFSSPAWREDLPRVESWDLVVSGFAIHHQTHERKKSLYREVFELLSPDGVFLNLEHVASPSSQVEALFDSFFVDHLVCYHGTSESPPSRSEIEESYYNRPDKQENILADVGEQCDWLREMGFSDVDCFFKTFELALFGGRKVSEANPITYAVLEP
jgi:ubiquinone/menaquinone biosynthesis C-methylase UbiE